MKTGAQLGNNNAARTKPWRDALEKAIKQYIDRKSGIQRGEALFRIATQVVKQALDGNTGAIQELGNRLDGKPHQSMDIGISDNTPVEEMTDADIARELAATTSAVIARNAGKKKRKKKPARVLN